MKITHKVRTEDYKACKEECKDSYAGIEVECLPVDMNGHYEPVGISAADKSRNFKKVGEDIRARVGC